MSHQVHFSFGKKLSRRTMLRSAGVAMSMPWLSAMNQAFAGSDKPAAPRRFVAMTLGLGLHAENLNPTGVGKDYEPSLYLQGLQDIRDRFTVISGTSHPGVNGGHRAEASLLSATPMGSGAQSRTTISVDQLLAKHLGNQTRFPSLVLSSAGSNSPSYTENGSMIPAESSPARLFLQLFVTDSPAEQKKQIHRARQGQSIMDLVAEDAKALQRELGDSDRDRLDAYFTSVRELEKRMVDAEEWANRPKPEVDYAKPIDISNPNDFIGRQRLMNDMIRLALSTDSTRFVSYHLGGSGGVVPIKGVDEGYHSLSHHGRDEEKLAQLALIETEIVRAYGDFLRGLDKTEEDGETLLDRTSVLLTSNLGNASNHDNRNMPVLFAGGGFRHGQHLAFDQKKNYPLPNLYLSMLQKTGLEVDQFATSTGTMTGLDG
ncbi:DUF1552 domain-containing protein [Blastopirellula sp. JC732]|uniref:DUF1552 domain-containing protein n=1 Tax=Blastopirellula sediminis TaxID=2894196 RepID=A0A9X1MM89_9BACT|nr:DUF1552 domain-containing protein [Blastopirellula sediminis]MCC9607301.1 DUF1552 domain-containing protein [Blastopirellula sediminis]MCC9629406.1 DUF1552 domain-containing protein [Blastopirellula sediminis]